MGTTRAVTATIAIGLLGACNSEPSKIEMKRRRVQNLAAHIQKAGGTASFDVSGNDGEILVTAGGGPCTEQSLTMQISGLEYFIRDEHFVLVECAGPYGPVRINVAAISNPPPPRPSVAAVPASSDPPPAAKPTATRPTRRPIEVEADDPDRYAFGLVESFEKPTKPKPDAGVVDALVEAPAKASPIADPFAPPPDAAAVAPTPGLPDALTRQMFANGLAAVNGDLENCVGEARKLGEGGEITLVVNISADGNVISAKTDSVGHRQLSACMVEATKNALFAKTTNGGTFRKPFRF